MEPITVRGGTLPKPPRVVAFCIRGPVRLRRPVSLLSKVIAAQQRTAFDVPLADLGDLLVVPALGMFLPVLSLKLGHVHASGDELRRRVLPQRVQSCGPQLEPLGETPEPL